MKRVFLLVIILLTSIIAHADHEPDSECICASHSSIFKVDQLLACHANSACDNHKMDIEIALKFKGRQLVDVMKSYLRLSNSPLLSHEEHQHYIDLVKQSKVQLMGIAAVTPFEWNMELVEPLFIDFDYPDRHYHRYYNAFNFGFEYVSLEHLSESAFPRLGLFFYRRYGETPSHGEGYGNYGVHMRVSFQLTSSGEQEGKDSTRINNTLDASGELFFPRFHSMISLDQTLSDYTGLLLVYNVKKVSRQDQVVNRFYAGARTAVNPETFFDVLFGGTEGISSTRMELRGQIPLYKFTHGTRIFFGSTLNMSLPWEKESDDKDVVRFYIDWNADFERIITGFSAALGI